MWDDEKDKGAGGAGGGEKRRRTEGAGGVGRGKLEAMESKIGESIRDLGVGRRREWVAGEGGREREREREER